MLLKDRILSTDLEGPIEILRRQAGLSMAIAMVDCHEVDGAVCSEKD